MTAVADRMVRGYVDDLRRIRAAVLVRVPEFDNSLKSVWTRVRAGDLPRAGELPGEIHYQVHGTGCRFTDPDDVEIDMDFSIGGMEMFDWWRVERNARSRGFDGSVSREDLSTALVELVRSGQLHVVEDGWYALTSVKP